MAVDEAEQGVALLKGVQFTVDVGGQLIEFVDHGGGEGYVERSSVLKVGLQLAVKVLERIFDG